MLGIYINLYVAEQLSKTTLKYKLIEYVGKNSLSIMLLHFLSFKIIDLFITIIYKAPLDQMTRYPASYHGDYLWIIYTISGIIVPLITIKAYKNIKDKIKQSVSKSGQYKK